MAGNRVAANLLMFFFLAGGLLLGLHIKQEVFPEVELNVVNIIVPYPGASPVDVEEGIVLAVEEAVRGVDGVQQIIATAAEGMARITAELFTDTNQDRALNDIKSAVDRITSFPRDAEEPVISIPTNRREVVSLILYGNLTGKQLKEVSEKVRSDLLLDRRINEVEISGLPPPEISIEIPQRQLRRYGLTLEEVAAAARNASIDLPGGGIKTSAGEILIRTTEKRDTGDEFADITVIGRKNGVRLTLGELGTVVDGFRDEPQQAYFNGKLAARVRVYRTGDQTPLEVSRAVREYLERTEPQSGVLRFASWNDRAEIYWDRIGLLLKNGAMGLTLVLLILGLFLEPRLAFWVTLGMVISFMGAFLAMAAFDVSINMISLFAFILALGIVVDDAIVVGESVYYQRRGQGGSLEASVRGAREVAMPVTFAVLTTVTAFFPLLMVSGVIGKFFRNIPLVVIPILLVSLVESFFILPAHLAHSGRKAAWGAVAWLESKQKRFSEALTGFIENRYGPAADRMLRYRYLTLSVSLALLIISFGLVAGGRISFVFLPKIESDTVSAVIELPFGAVEQETFAVTETVTAAARRVLEGYREEGRGRLDEGIYTQIGGLGEDMGGTTVGRAGGAHLAEVTVALIPAGKRQVSAAAFSEAWRREIDEIPGVERLAFQYSVGPPAGAKISLVLTHEDRDLLRQAAERLAAKLDTYEGVFDIDDGFETGKEQLNITLKPGARSYGITERDLAFQLRSSFFGAEAVRQQRGRDELRIYARLPRGEERTEYAVEKLLIRTPEGGEIPLEQAAFIQRGASFTEIERRNGRRAVEVTADVDSRIVTAGEISRDLEMNFLSVLRADFPGLDYEPGGEQEERQEAMASLATGMQLAAIVMFSLLAVAFRSYIQPLIVMLAIPFGAIGAVAGHLLLGYDLSIMSLFGLVALSGVVVNDSLVLVAAVNAYREKGRDVHDAVLEGSKRRFRPILLTSLTTFFGLAPIIFETSVQARFLIPMALSLGFGVLFVTLITLVIVPACYLMVEDIRAAVTGSGGGNRPAS